MIAYTTYEKERFLEADNKASSRAIMPYLGFSARNSEVDEWNKNHITGVLEGILVIK